MEALIIIPGWITKYIVDKEHSIADYYENIMPFFEKDFNVKIIEFPGFGTNPEPEKPWALDDFVNYLLEQLNQLEIRNFHIIGHSFGGQVATKFAYLYPEKVEKLVLYNSACIRDKKEYSHFLKKIGMVIFAILPFLRWIFYKIFTGSTSYLKLPKIMQKTMSNILKEDLTEILPKIKTETLVLWGSNDKITPLNQGLKIKKLIPNSKIVVHPGGHNFHLQDPKTFTEYVKNFIAE